MDVTNVYFFRRCIWARPGGATNYEVPPTTIQGEACETTEKRRKKWKLMEGTAWFLPKDLRVNLVVRGVAIRQDLLQPTLDEYEKAISHSLTSERDPTNRTERICRLELGVLHNNPFLNHHIWSLLTKNCR